MGPSGLMGKMLDERLTDRAVEEKEKGPSGLTSGLCWRPLRACRDGNRGGRTPLLLSRGQWKRRRSIDDVSSGSSMQQREISVICQMILLQKNARRRVNLVCMFEICWRIQSSHVVPWKQINKLAQMVKLTLGQMSELAGRCPFLCTCKYYRVHLKTLPTRR